MKQLAPPSEETHPADDDEKLRIVATTVFSLLIRLGRICMADQMRYQAPFGVTPSQYGVMNILLLSDRVSFKELSSLAAVHGSVLSRVVDQLEKKGLARRTTGQTDRRRVYVELTDAGRDLLATICPLDDQGALCQALRQLGTDNAEQLRTQLADLGRLLGDNRHDQILAALFSHWPGRQ